MKEIKLTPKPKKKVRVYSEVRNHHTEDDTGNIAIDVYKTEDENEEGTVLCWVTPDGKILLGKYATGLEPTLDCILVREKIQEALDSQEEFKQKLVDEVLEELQEAGTVDPNSDRTVLDELLKFIPCKFLMGALDEEKWKDYPSDFSKQEDI